MHSLINKALYQQYHPLCLSATPSLGARPLKNRKGESGKQGGVEVYTVECSEFYYLLNLAKPVEFFAEPDTRTSVLSFPLSVYSFLKRSKKTKMVLVRLAHPINAHHNVNQKPIGSAPAYWVQCTLPPHPFTRPFFSIS